MVLSFGSAPVSASTRAEYLSFTLSGLSSTPTVSLGGVDFSVSSFSCNKAYTACTAGVVFAPLSVGLKQDALVLKNSSGTPIASAFLNGIGTAPALRALPATIATFAGTGTGGLINGGAAAAAFRNPQGLAIDLQGNLYVADSVNQVIRKITTAGVVSTLAGNGGAGYSGDGGPALLAMLKTPTGIALDAAGNLFIADEGNGLIRRVDAFTGIITTVAGGGNSAPNGVSATNAALSGPTAVAIDTSGNLYIADTFANLILQVSASGSITTIAGGGTTASGTDGIGDDGPATSAELNSPTGVALDASGNVYISDTAHSMVRVVSVGSGIITALAGTGSPGYSGDGELALNAQLGQPAGLRLDANNNLYIADTSMQVVRFVNATSGVISTLAGNGSAGYTGDGEAATAATFNNPSDVVLNTAGSVFVADYANNVIRQISFLPPALTFPSTSITLTSASVPVTISNYGNAALNLSNLAISSGFEQTPTANNCSASSSLAPGVTCAIPLAFDPSTAGLITGTATVTSNDANRSSSQLTINLTGTAISGIPAASASPSSLAFGNQAVGVASTGQTITLGNKGSAPLTISTILIAGLNVADFLLTARTCQSTLAAGSSCSVTIQFSPRQSGSRTATVNFIDSATNSPQIVALSGTGTGGPIPTLSVNSIQFGSTPVLTSAAAQTVTLTNTGVATLDIYGMALSGASAAQFFLNSSTCESTLTAGASCTVSLGFDPTTAGVFSAQLLLTLSAGNSLLYVSLSGTGVTSTCVTSVSPASQSYPSSGASGSLAITAASGCAWTATPSASWIVITSPTGSGTATLSLTIRPNTSTQPRTGTITVGSQTETIVQTAGLGLRFIPVTPCRIADTRNAQGPFGKPSIAGNSSRDFIIPNSTCGIPANAQAYALNVTAVPQGPLSYITVWPSGQSQPNVSTLNSNDGRVKANAVIVPAGSDHGVSVYATNTTDIVLDINGYFVPESNTSALAFYTLTPCRLIDTRSTNTGGPFISGNTTRSFPVLPGPCNVPSSAQAYSLNFTVVPKSTALGYLTTWPTGQTQPLVSTLNNPTKTVVANAAIVPAGSAGYISVYASNDTDLIIDIDGYFAPASGSSALSLYNLTPCRILDTRDNYGAPFSYTITPSLSACPVSGAQSLVINATVIPEPALSYLSLWPAGTPEPQVSTLNANDGSITSNLAIVPLSGTGLSAYAAGTTHLLLDLFAYFAP